MKPNEELTFVRKADMAVSDLTAGGYLVAEQMKRFIQIAIKANVCQLAIAKLGQFADIALIVPERLDHANEREQHGSLLRIYDSALGRNLIVEMNIGQSFSFQKIKWCGAAKHTTHGEGKNRLTLQHSCPKTAAKPALSSAGIPEMPYK